MVRMWGCMDELIAAAAAVKMTTDANADNDMGQHAAGGTIGAADVEMLAAETPSEDKENEGGCAANQEVGDANQQVLILP